MLEITPYLVNSDQVGFVKGHQAPDSMRRMINLIDYVENIGTPSLLLGLDVEKAFNRVHWNYIARTLEKFGFSGFIHEAIMLLYTQPSAKVSTSGMLSKTFNLANGTRQGCPLSPIIFSSVIEPLVETIRSNENISGIKIGDRIHEIGLFADGIILSLTNLNKSLHLPQSVLNSFSKVCYYNINNRKSFALPMNISKDTFTILKEKYNDNWDASSFTYLGINLTFPTKKLYAANFPKLLYLISKDFQNIKQTHLSWIGKIAAFKMQTLPKILYQSIPIPIPSSFFKILNTKLRNLVWKKNQG